jgi:NADH-quinone oxidoreductase subunit D
MKSGDSFARSILPIYDIRESIKIIRQCIRDLPEGEIKAKLTPNFKAKKGESFSRVESGRGEVNHYIVSDGAQKAYRHSISPPSLKNLPALPFLLRGATIADLPLIYWSLNIWPIEIER